METPRRGADKARSRLKYPLKQNERGAQAGSVRQSSGGKMVKRRQEETLLSMRLRDTQSEVWSDV